jgi:hypothetical protein
LLGKEDKAAEAQTELDSQRTRYPYWDDCPEFRRAYKEAQSAVPRPAAKPAAK